MIDDMESFTPDALIERYWYAYLWANDRPPPPIVYERGWFVLGDIFAKRVRRREVVRWIIALENRPKAIAKG